MNRRTGTCVRAALALFAVALHASAQATTFTVANTADTGAGSLRQALIDANAAGGTNTIAFAIPGAGAHTIAIAAPLPSIKGTLTIDGYTQAGSAMNTHAPDDGGLDTVLAIEISGGDVQSYGFIVDSGQVSLTVQGVAMNGFTGSAIGGNGGAPVSAIAVYGCFLGTHADGSALPTIGNRGSAIRSGLGNAQIGGTLAWQRNLLSGNGGAGILSGGAAVIQGNLIGTDATGTFAIANGTVNNWGGIIVGDRSHVHIGGASADARNVISGNRPIGIGVWSSFGSQGSGADFKLEGNYIGTDWTGAEPVPNGFAEPAAARYGGGIQIQSGSSDGEPLIIGGFGDGEANLIAFNTGAGIVAGTNAIGESFDSRANVLHHNRGVGRANLDIGAPGPTANDGGDADGGANLQQNAPELIAASHSGTQLSVSYRVDSAPANATYPLRIDFYENVNGGSGRWIAQDVYAIADAQQMRSVVLTVPADARALPFVATATSADGYTSELSAAYDVLFEDGFE